MSDIMSIASDEPCSNITCAISHDPNITCAMYRIRHSSDAAPQAGRQTLSPPLSLYRARARSLSHVTDVTLSVAHWLCADIVAYMVAYSYTYIGFVCIHGCIYLYLHWLCADIIGGQYLSLDAASEGSQGFR